MHAQKIHKKTCLLVNLQNANALIDTINFLLNFLFIPYLELG